MSEQLDNEVSNTSRLGMVDDFFNVFGIIEVFDELNKAGLTSVERLLKREVRTFETYPARV